MFGIFSHYKLKMFFFSLLIPVLLVLGLSGGMVRGLGSASTGVEREREREKELLDLMGEKAMNK